MITQNVMKRIRSRAGKGSPASVLIGIASAAASDTAPRMPTQEPRKRVRQSARRARCDGRRSRVRMTTVVPKTHAMRTAITTPQMAAASTRSSRVE